MLVGMMGRLIVRCFVAEATCGPMETLIGAQAATFVADLAVDNSPLKREYEEAVLMLEPLDRPALLHVRRNSVGI
ncbi:hypothetical protein Tco_1470058 [Tanacetum coccineum]